MKDRFHRLSPELIITAIYMLAGTLWIVYSDQVVRWMANDVAETIVALQTFKGLIYVFASGVLVYALSHWAVGQERRMKKRAREYSDRLEYALRCAHQGLWELFPEDDFGFRLSSEVFTMLGYEPRSGAEGGEFFTSLIHPDDRNRVVNSVRKMVRNGGDEEFRMVFRVKDSAGERRTILSCGRVVERLSDGRAGHVMGTHTDITESLAMEQAKHETEARFTRLIGNTPGAVYRCENDARWSMIFISEGCRMVTGYTPEQLQGNRELAYADLIVPEDRQSVWAEIQRKLRDTEPFELEYRIHDSDGNIHVVWERGCGVYDETGTEVVALEGFIYDVTALRKAENHALDMARLVAECPRPVLRVDDAGILKYANPASEELLRHWDCRLGKRLPDAQCDIVTQVLAHGESKLIKEQVTGITYAVHFVPIIESGNVNIYATDITHRSD